MIIKRLACGLLLSGVIGIVPASAQSALAQQDATQQGQKTTVTKPATAAPTTSAKPATAAVTPAAQPSAKTTGAKPATAGQTTATTTAKKSPPKPLVYVDNPTLSSRSANATAGKSADASASKSANASAGKVTDASAKKSADVSAKQKPQNADVVKAFQQNCPGIALSDDKKKAGYDVMFEREPGSKGVKTGFGLTNTVRKTSKIEVMSKSGKEVFSETGHSTSQLVKDACAAIEAPAATKIARK
jgi:hypothetical protein